MPFYGVYVPPKTANNSSAAATSSGNATSTPAVAVNPISAGVDSSEQNSGESPYVFLVKCKALEVLRSHKDARLREFASEDDALKYAQTGYEVVQTKYPDVKASVAALEKAMFRAPTKQELIEFRKVIEAGDYERVKTMIWDNPRYLVSSGDTPTTLKEGYRYNAMHVCAISKQPRIAELILQTVSDPKFVGLLTGKKNDQKMCRELCVNLLDYYLNIPEKGRSETPLHLAAKNGGYTVIEVLTSYPECKMTPNNLGQLPKDIICSRVGQPDPQIYAKIESMLEERFYVPVLRTMDSAIPPQIGQPFSANNPPNLNCDPLSPEVKIQALAGPMTKDQAKQFCRRWKTPPRIGSTASSPIANNPFISPMKSRSFNNSLNKTPGFGSPTSTPLQRRALFDITPQNSPNHSNSTQEQNNSHTSNQLSARNDGKSVDDLSLADKQNGNHKNDQNEGHLVEGTITSKESESFKLESENSNVEIESSKLETNNNNHHHEDEQLPVDQSNQGTEIISSSISSSTTVTRTLFPDTPILKTKKDIFFTYRESHVPSPIVFNTQNDNCSNDSMSSNAGGLEGEVDSPPETTTSCVQKEKKGICLRTSMLKNALCSKEKQSLFSLTTSKSSSNLNLSTRNIYDSPGFKERHIKISDTEKGLEMIGRELAKEQKVEWREYWDFLNILIDIASEDGLQKLEEYFAQRVREEESSKRAAQASVESTATLDHVCNALEKFVFAKEISGHDSHRNGFTSGRSRYDYAGPTRASNSSALAPQTTTPYTCVEKSLQVFAKRMTKTIVHNSEYMTSINNTLLSELKRLKSLICSFKEDVRFLDVNFSKVHSRISNLISIYLANSQEVTAAVKMEIQKTLQNLLLMAGERREHIECVCSRILHLLENPTDQILPENLKTEEICARTWQQEKECKCQWETNLSRKTSRRNRMEARYRSHQQARQQEKLKRMEFNAASASGSAKEKTTGDPTATSNDSEDEANDDVFWSDFGGTDTEEDEVWGTPPESPSRLSLIDNPEDDGFNIFIYGNEPTKRDLDVLNAVFHVEIDKLKYPNIHSWKSALLRYPSEEMDYFPSPSVIKKSHSFVIHSAGRKELPTRTPPLQRRQLFATVAVTSTPGSAPATASAVAMGPPVTSKSHHSQLQKQSQSQNDEQQQQQHQLPTAKRLFTSPSVHPTSHRAFITPLNKLRGLFSLYRERLDSDTTSVSTASPVAGTAFSSDHSVTEGTNNLSLLNISASK